MGNNIILIEQNIFTLTPLLFSFLIAIMLITGKHKHDIALTIGLIIDGICTTIILYGNIEIVFVFIDISSVILVLWSVFRKRNKK